MRLAPGQNAADGRIALLTAALGFLCFMPYPSISIGNTSAIQIGNILSLLMCVPIVALSWKHRPFWIFPLILAPLCIAGLKVAMTGQDGLDLCFKAISVWGISCLSLLVVQLYAPRYALHLLTGIAAATVIHAGVGLLQLYYFSFGQFPLAGLYVNQSFLSVQDNAQTIARWIQRPFGIFPEPSAMSSSLAPWVLFWFAWMCGLIRLKQAPARWQRALFAMAALGGMSLILLSRSGHAAVTVAAAVLFGAVWLKRSQFTARTSLAILGLFGVILPILLWLLVLSLGERMGGGQMGNSSWRDRSDSLLLGFQLLTGGNLTTAFFGMGPGLSSVAIWKTAHLEAVWSVLLTYIYETGILGTAALCWIGHHLYRTWRNAHCDVVFAAITAVWLVGITVTTSYTQLLPLWVALGWLSIWPAVCEPVAAAEPHGTNRLYAARRIKQSTKWISPAAGAFPLSQTEEPALRLRKRWTD